MNNHRVRLVSWEGEWQARCSCKDRSGFGGKADAAAWEWEHLQDVQRARTALARTPSLRVLRDHYLHQATDPNVDAHERHLWQQLADELENQIKPDHDENQMELW